MKDSRMAEFLKPLLDSLPQVGRIRWIGIRPERRQPLDERDEVVLETGMGIQGDRYRKKGGKRQVSLIQYEHFDVIGALIGRPILPGELRRNLVVEGFPVAALRRLRFSIGDAVLEGSERCAPCTRMQEALGPGGYAAMMDMGGVLARVLNGGTIRVGDEVRGLGLAQGAANVETK